MKISLFKNRLTQGGAMIVVAIGAVVVAGVLAVYLIMLENENTAVARSQTWNRAMVAAEAGVEEALAMVNKNVGSSGSITNWNLTATTDGWDTGSSNLLTLTWTSANGGGSRTWTNSPTAVYHIQRTLDSTNGFYDVYVAYSTNGWPEILSVGQVVWNAGGNNFSAGNATRKVHLQTVGLTQVAGGMIALSTMDFKGNNVTIDSFNSGNPLYSVWQSKLTYHGTNFGIWTNYPALGFNYSTATSNSPSRTANVYVATDGQIINVGNANIAGYVDTAPGGSVSINANGLVGDLGWVFTSTGGTPGTGSGIQDGHQKSDMNQQFQSKSLPNPSANGWQPVNGWLEVSQTPKSGSTTWAVKIGGTWTNMSGIGWTNIGGIYYTNFGSGWTIQGHSYKLVITNRPANNTNLVYYEYPTSGKTALGDDIFVDGWNQVLYLPNGLSYNNNTFTLNTNSDVKIYTSSDISAGGNAVINNYAQYSLAFQIYDVAGTTPNISFSGPGAGTALLYVPSSSLSFNGGAAPSGGYDVVGAIFCHDIQINGHYNFHFDEQLKVALPIDQFYPTLWEEVF